MNLANLAESSVTDRRFSEVTCEPPALRDSKWRNVQIECRHTSSDLSGVVFTNCGFQDCYFGNARLVLRESVFESCVFRDVRFMYANLAKARFVNCRLDRCHLRSADLRGALFRGCHLVSVNLEKADLNGASFESTELDRMYDWGWHGYHGAAITDEQKFKYFIASNVVDRLAAALRAGQLVLPPADDPQAFLNALSSSPLAQGEVMLIWEEWKDQISFPAFIAIGKYLAQ